jgi:hypothetical protein
LRSATAAAAITAIVALVPTVATAAPVSQVVTARVTLGANDPVVGASVVVRRASNGDRLSATVRTGPWGIASVRVRADAHERITIWAGGGRARVGTTDVLRRTTRLADMTTGFEYLNPLTTVMSVFAERHPGVTLAAGSHRVRRFLSVPVIKNLPAHASYSAVVFSGRRFAARAARDGGVHAHATHVVQAMDAGRSARRYRGTRAEAVWRAPRGGQGQTPNDVAETSVVDTLKSIGGGLSTVCTLLCERLGLTYSPEADTKLLRAQMLDGFAKLQAGLTTLNTLIAQTQASQARVEDALMKMRGDAALRAFSKEYDDLRAVTGTLSEMVGVAGQYYATHDTAADPASPEGTKAAENINTLAKGLKQLLADGTCPDIGSLVGQVPAAATAGYSGPCTGIERVGVLQLAQAQAASGRFLSAWDQRSIDAAGADWLGVASADVVMHGLAWKYAVADGTGTLTAASAAATSAMLTTALGLISADTSGAYFGVRIPKSFVVNSSGLGGTVYAIGRITGAGGNYVVAPPALDTGEVDPGTATFAPSNSVVPASAPALRRAGYCQFLRPATGAAQAIANAYAGCASADVPTVVPGPDSARNYGPRRPGGGPIQEVVRSQLALPNLQVALPGNGACSPFEIRTGVTGTYPSKFALVYDEAFPTTALLRGYRCPVFDTATATTGANCAITDGATGGDAGVVAMYPSFNGVPLIQLDSTRQIRIAPHNAQAWFDADGAFPNLCPNNTGPNRWTKAPALSFTPPVFGPPPPLPPRPFWGQVRHHEYAGDPGSMSPYRPGTPPDIRDYLAQGCFAAMVQSCVKEMIGGDDWTLNNTESGDYVVGALFEKALMPQTFVPASGT